MLTFYALPRCLVLALYHPPSESAPLSMGPGAFVAALEAACHREASSTTVCGKPSEAFLRECIAGMMSREDESMDNYTNIIVSRGRDEKQPMHRRELTWTDPDCNC